MRMKNYQGIGYVCGFFLILTTTLLLTACKSPMGTSTSEFCKVSFEADGGEPEPEAQLVSKGGLIAEPEAMTRSGNKCPLWRQVHINKNFHASARATSRH